jgi:hypothetical protein
MFNSDCETLEFIVINFTNWFLTLKRALGAGIRGNQHVECV